MINFKKIPQDWEVKRIGKMTKTLAGGTPSTSNVAFWGGEIKWMSSGELNLKKVYDVEGRITELGLKSSSTRILPPYCVLIGLAGQGKTRGTVAMNMIELCTNQSVAAILPAPDFSEEYLYYNLDFRYDELRQLSTGDGGRGGLNLNIINSVQIPLPPLSEQKAIAKVLNTADTAIHAAEKLIAQKELRKKWLMQQLLTGKKRLKGFSGKWRKEKLEKYLIKHDEKTTFNDQYPVLTSSRKGIFLQSEYYTRDVASEDNTGYNVVPRGYFTYRHMSDDLIFKFNINDIVDRGIVSTLYPVFTTKEINDYFLKAKLNEGNEFKMHAGEQKQGGSRTYVYFNTLCQLEIYMPSFDEQTAIAQVLQTADKEIGLLKAKAEKLIEQKKGLMQQLLTGKVRLKINE